MPSAQARGIDVYHGDHIPDWKTIQGYGISFVFHKASESISSDPAFAERWKTLGEFGMTRGAYHLLNCAQSGRDQAEHFLSLVTLTKSDLPAVLDIEELGRHGADASTVVVNAKNWLAEVERRTGKVPIVYVSPSFASEFLGDTFGRYPLWLAHYAPHPHIPAGWDDWTFWQYAEAGGLHAYDVDWYNGSHDDLVARFHLGD